MITENETRGCEILLKRFISAIIFSLLLVTAGAAYAADGAVLPEIKGWENGELRTTQMGALSGYKGKWEERTYRTNQGIPFRAIWVEGAGADKWDVNEMSSDHGEIWGGETQKPMQIEGCSALLEYRPVVGYSLIIKVKKDAVLTLESQVSTEAALTAAGATLVKNIK